MGAVSSPIATLQRIADRCARGEPLSPADAVWLAARFGEYLAGGSVSLERALQLPSGRRDRADSAPAQRQRAYRQRQRQGMATIKVVIPFDRVVSAMLETGRLTEIEALDRDQIERAAAAILVEWSRQRVKDFRYA